MEPKYIVAIEIGSSLIKGAVGAIDNHGTLKVCAIEEREMVGCVRYGCIQNVEEVRACVADIIVSLEARANVSPRKVKGAYVSLGGRSLMSYKRDVEISFEEETEITNDVINRLLDEAREESLTDKDIVDIVPMGFVVDNMNHNNPIGTFGHNLRVSLNIIACRPQIIKNLNRVIEDRLQLSVNDYIVRQTALAKLVLSPKEIQLGCVLVDFGAETTTLSIYKSSVLQYLVTIPMGSRNITRDLMSLSITEEHAENIKYTQVNANPQETTGNGGKSSIIDGVDDNDVNSYVQYRAGEIVANIVEQINASGFKNADLSSGIVVVGRGAKLNGFNALLENMSLFKVRSGMIPSKVLISDNRIQPCDALDVIAVLFAVAQSGESAAECLSAVRVEEPETQPQEIEITSHQKEVDDEEVLRQRLAEEDDELDDDFQEEAPKKSQKAKKTSSWYNKRLFERIQGRIKRYLDESDYDNVSDDDDR